MTSRIYAGADEGDDNGVVVLAAEPVMRRPRTRSLLLSAIVSALALAGCGGGTSQSASQPSATPASVEVTASPGSVEVTASPTSVAATVAPETASPATSPSPEPSAASASPEPTQNPNLLSFARGTFVRSWSATSLSGAEALATGSSYAIDPKFNGTTELVFELPAVAHIDRIAAEASVPDGATAQLHLAVATADAHAFGDVGTISLSPTSRSGSLQGPWSARWIRVRVERTAGASVWIQSLTATGELAAPTARFSGRWALADSLYGSDAVFAGVKGAIPAGGGQTGTNPIAATEGDGTLTAAACTLSRDVWRGSIQGGSAQLEDGGSLTVAGGGSLLVGVVTDGGPILARRIARAPACDPPPTGRGSKIAIITRYPDRLSKFGGAADVGGYRYQTAFLPLLSADDLRGANVALLAMSCQPTKDTQAWQRQALLDFVSSGHVLIVRDADACSKSEYQFIPYPFTTSATGAQGARGSVLSIADSSVLAGSDPSDRAHFVDTAAYLKHYLQQLGDADIMETTDPHWCGLMFAKNATGASGWVRAYARYGKGVIVYDGFDADDLHSQIPQAIALSRLAYGLSPNADLPCNAHVASELLLLSSVHRTVAFGTVRDLRFTFTVDREGDKTVEPIALSIGGERGAGWHASVDRRRVTLGASAQHVNVVVHVPANATATRHLFTLTATAPQGQNAQAAIEIDVNEALAKELEKGGRARIYGIHFDVASARIQAGSEAIIREIALVLRTHPAWRMRVEGHTDSDGGAAYNLALSERRAQSVVDNLTRRYGIARARLKAAGYGLARPVASNATDAGKALNRRVELVCF